ncbi:ABC transporter permease [Streptomyces sp. NPDC049879]|uniref:ABC transporter permease n=1 Tax=Streptomyces sp. NPDC049879 TaxID=3365598 RepID=UPI0037B82163
MSVLSTWRLALRIARRDAVRAKGRSALVVAMIALPILGVSGADLLFRTGELSPAEALTRELGAADAEFRVETDGAIEQTFEGDVTTWLEDSEYTAPDPAADLALVTGLLPPGSTVLPDISVSQRFDVGDGVVRAELREIDAADPLTEGMFTRLDGRFPEAADEVVVTEHFLDESGLALGDELTVGESGVSARVVGTYELPSGLDEDEVIALPGAVIPRLGGDTADDVWGSYLVGVPDGVVDWPLVKEANTQGVVVRSRAVTLDPPPDSEAYGSMYSDGSGDSEFFVAVGVVVSLVILEICLLAGPAFAVGVRRSRRQLGLIGANGGDRRHLRAITLASGVVLGAAAAVVGVLGGVAVTVLARPWLEETTGSRFGAWDFRVTELGAIAALAVLVGTLAALVPAVTASRGDVLESLTGRRGVRHGSRVLPVVGTVALLAGAAAALAGAVTMDSSAMVAGGAIVAELGVVALTPALVGAFGRLGRRLPLSGRLALRDAARNRGRSAPAVAAILAAVAGLVAVSTVLVSDEERQRAEYTAAVPEGTVTLYTWAGEDDMETDLTRARQAVERELPVAERADIATVDVGYGCEADDCGYMAVAVPEASRCPLDGWESAQDMTVEERRRLAEDPRCVENIDGGTSSMTSVAVAGPELLRLLGADSPEALAALADGGAVVFRDGFRDAAGEVTLQLWDTSPDWDDATGTPASEPDRSWTFPAVTATVENVPAASPEAVADLLITPETAERAGLGPVDMATYWSTDRMPDAAERRALDGAMEQVSDSLYWDVERGFQSSTSMPLLILTLAALVLTIGAAGIATGLAQADSAADLATLAAVGAAPRVRRTLSGLQCGVIAFMGVVLGAVSGLVPGIALVLADHRSSVGWWDDALESGWVSGGRPELYLDLPWVTFGELLIGVPLVACVLAALLTRSRITLARRAG